eukprot:a679069_33.p1 GENE.a679069_33~~a679069_33.p1  ORF type:complete len:301 (+),score=76.97 a679069_33:32-904(+)
MAARLVKRHGSDDDPERVAPVDVAQAPAGGHVLSGLLQRRWVRMFLYTTGALVGLALLWLANLRSYDQKAVMLDMLRCEIELFDAHNITWWLEAGSHLGAVRNKGMASADSSGDIDIALLAPDVPKVIALMPEFHRRWGHRMIHRDQVSWWPKLLDNAFVIYRAAFRHFYRWYLPIYIDLREFEIVDNRVVTLHYLWSRSAISFAWDEVFPLRLCEFEGIIARCPRDDDAVLTRQYGASWRIPNPKMRTRMLSPEQRGVDGFNKHPSMWHQWIRDGVKGPIDTHGLLKQN